MVECVFGILEASDGGHVEDVDVRKCGDVKIRKKDETGEHGEGKTRAGRERTERRESWWRGRREKLGFRPMNEAVYVGRVGGGSRWRKKTWQNRGEVKAEQTRRDPTFRAGASEATFATAVDDAASSSVVAALPAPSQWRTGMASWPNNLLLTRCTVNVFVVRARPYHEGVGRGVVSRYSTPKAEGIPPVLTLRDKYQGSLC